MNTHDTAVERIERAARTSRLLAGKSSTRVLCDAFVRDQLADIRMLQARGVSLARYARLIAPDLQVPPAALLRAIGRALSQQTPPSAAEASGAEAAKSKATTAQQTPPQPAPRSLRGPGAKPIPPGKPERHSTIPSAILPDWADYADQMPGESDDDYIFRKSLDTPPQMQRKFIGEHDRHA
ncbi:MAG: hypothetical protein ACP5GC_09445 [Thiomonas sp.]